MIIKYEIGKRTGAWIKIKLHHEQEFAIGGFMSGRIRKYFGALLVGVYEDKKFKFAGRVGTGFTDKLLRSLHLELEKIRIDACPFFKSPGSRTESVGPRINRRRDETLPMGQTVDGLVRSNSLNGRRMIVFDIRSFWEFGRTKVPRMWFGRKLFSSLATLGVWLSRLARGKAGILLKLRSKRSMFNRDTDFAKTLLIVSKSKPLPRRFRLRSAILFKADGKNPKA